MEGFAADLETVLAALGELENGAIYIALGLFAYMSLKIAAPAFVILKLARHAKEWAMGKKVVVNEVHLDKELISSDDTGEYIKTAIREMKAFENRSGYESDYLHRGGAKKVLLAVQEYIDRNSKPQK